MKKSKIIMIIIAIILVIILGILFLKDKDEKEKLTIVTEALYQPYEYYEDGEIVGIDIDIAKEIAKEMGKELEIIDVDFSNVFNELNNNNAQLCIAGLTITEERKQQVDFTIPYITTKEVMVVKNNSGYKKLTDLKGKIISVQVGTAVEKYIIQNYDEKNIKYTNSTPESISDVLLGKADAVAMPYDTALKLINENSEFRIIEEELYKADYGIAVKKGNTKLLKQINKIIEKLEKNGKIDEILEKYN